MLSATALATTLLLSTGIHYLSATFDEDYSNSASDSDFAVRLHESIRLQTSLNTTHIFQLNADCGESCRNGTKSYLTKEFACTYVNELTLLETIEGRCTAGPKLRALHAGELKDNITANIQKSYENTLVHICPHAQPREIVSETRILSGVREVQEDSMDFDASLASSTVSRFVQTNLDARHWYLDRIDQLDFSSENRLDGRFDLACFPKQGHGSTVYVIDTGCKVDHIEFEGRASQQSTAFSNAADDNGHGTHVAGLVGGKTTGVCKKCKMVCMKAMNRDGAGSFSDVIEAIEHVLEMHRSTAGRSVVVMSLAGEGTSTMFDRAIKSLYNAGIVPVVSAGNYMRDACVFTPANIPEAVTVGATTRHDELLTMSNYGKVRERFGLNAFDLIFFFCFLRNSEEFMRCSNKT